MNIKIKVSYFRFMKNFLLDDININLIFSFKKRQDPSIR